MTLDTGLPALRLAAKQARRDREAAWRELFNTTSQADDLDRRLQTIPAHLPGASIFVQPILDGQQEANGAKAGATSSVENAQNAADAADAAYDAAAAAEPVLWDTGNDLPVLLLPVRIETVYRQAGAAAELWIRVYPDDVHIDAHETALTATEREAAERYWQQVGAPGADDQSRAVSWREVLALVGASRGLWAIECIRAAADGAADTGSRDGVWTRAPQAAVMPHHFTFSGYREGRLIWRVDGVPIPDDLPAGFAPPDIEQEPGNDVDAAGTVPWQSSSRWLVDFDTAVGVGMATRIPLNDPNLHYDFVTAVGVGIADPATEAQRVEDLFVAHTYASGLSVLPAGAPTNNTPGSRSAWVSRPGPRSPQDIDQARADVAAVGDQSAARRTAAALGIDATGSLAAIPGGAINDEELAADAHAFVGQLMMNSPDWLPDRSALTDLPVDIGFLAEHFTAFVRSRGPLPTLRIGRQPYGVLPVTSTDLWRGDDVNEATVLVLSSVLSYFKDQVYRAQRVGAGPDQDAVILDLLSRRPASIRIRFAENVKVAKGPNGMFAHPPATIGMAAMDMSEQLAMRSPTGRTPPGFDFAAAVNPTPELMTYVSEDRPLATFEEVLNELEALAANWTVGQHLTFPDALPQPWWDKRTTLQKTLGQINGSTGGLFYQLAIPVFNRSLNVTVWVAVGAFGFGPETGQRYAASLKQLRSQAVRLEALAATRMPEIEQALCECLDTASHRVDAWVTSLATARLKHLRDTTPTGLHTGAFGWVSDLDPLPCGQGRGRDGYIVAPSLHHAATAAVLRSGCLAHSDPKAFAVNLTSERIRKALKLLDGIRNGQTLDYLLGYRFERALHDRSLDVHIAAFRERYPIAPVVDTAADGAAAAQASISARNVVDGLALSRDLAAFQAGHPTVAVGDDRGEITALVADLADCFDAVGDILLAESVHHIVGGNPLRAGLAADAASGRGALPDDFEVITTPRSADTVSYAVGAVVHGGLDAESAWSSDNGLAQYEPALENWCRLRLGSAGEWRFSCHTANGSPVTVTLADLGVGALELVRTIAAGATSTFAQRLIGTAGAESLADTDDGAGRYNELVTLAGALRQSIAGGSALLASHLDPVADPWAAVALDDIAFRIDTWLTQVQALADRLTAGLQQQPVSAPEVAGLIQQLAGCGLPVPVDVDITDADQLAAAGALVRDMIAAARLPAHPEPPPSGQARTAASAMEWFSTVTGLVHRLAGDGVPLLPMTNVAATGNPGLFEAQNRPSGVGEDELDDWIRDIGAVRPAVVQFTDVLNGAELVAGASAPSFAVTQAPVAAGQPWIAISRGTARSCCVLATDGTVDERSLVGIVFDSWVEVLPREGRQPGTAEEIAGVAFHSARPDARSPQAMLLAVPPDAARGWRAEDVHAVVEEAFDLAQVRGLDLTDLPELRGPMPLSIDGQGFDFSFPF
jgi:hypothetical protein